MPSRIETAERMLEVAGVGPESAGAVHDVDAAAGRVGPVEARLAETMEVAQKLYETGRITYMRTDSTALSAEAVEALRGVIAAKWGKEALPPSPVAHALPRVRGRSPARPARDGEGVLGRGLARPGLPRAARLRFTARLAEQLHRIAAGGADWKRLLDVFHGELRKRLSTAPGVAAEGVGA